MNRIDKQALDYLITSATAIGFEAVTIDSCEDKLGPPQVIIRFQQTRTPYMPVAQESTPQDSAQSPSNGPNKMATLDDDPQPIS